MISETSLVESVAPQENALLRIENLSVRIDRRGRRVAALSEVSLSVAPGEVVGLVGESGGGKSMVARAIIGMLPPGSRAAGRVLFDGADVLRMDKAALARHRGRGAAICFQNPRGALSPTRTVGRQLTDRLTVHQQMSDDRARESAAELFASVGIRNPGRRLAAYPHELSGGMAQRVMIALATGCAPGLLIADEPTTGLDVTLTRDILRQFRHAADTDGRGVLLISHDLASIAEVCDRVVVLYAGTVVETGPARQVLTEPAHPYTRALLRSVPDVRGGRVRPTAGGMPLLTEPPTSCPFAPRCVHATDDCRQTRPPLQILSGPERGSAAGVGEHWSASCFHPQQGSVLIWSGPAELQEPEEDRDGEVPTGRHESTGRTVLELKDAHVVYRSRFGSGGHHALRGVSLTLQAGQTLGVVGESGCGKSTLAKLVMGLVPPSEGSVTVAGKAVDRLSRVERTRAQMVFQDPIGSLSPRRTVGESIAEPLRTAKVPAAQRKERVAATVARMELDKTILTRYPHELSGGQAQRIGIARALIGAPELIVFDEPTSALDVTVAAQILEVIGDVATDTDRGAVFISHDLATVRSFADRVVVLYLGRVVEEGPVDEVFDDPQHPYTRALLGSAPTLGEIPTADVQLVKDLDEADAATGCPLAARCPFVTDTCRSTEQTLQSYGNRRAACWRIPEIPALIGKQTP